jgi:hypothetical protein
MIVGPAALGNILGLHEVGEAHEPAIELERGLEDVRRPNIAAARICALGGRHSQESALVDGHAIVPEAHVGVQDAPEHRRGVKPAGTVPID